MRFAKPPLLSWWQRLVLAIPFSWMVVFFLLPFVIVGTISFSYSRIGIPPYQPLLQWGQNFMPQIKGTLGNFKFIFQDELYINSYFTSLKIAGLSTLFCLAIGYPMALAIARANERRRKLYLMFVILPFWTSFLIRVYAWMGILKDEGILNTVLQYLHLIKEPLVIMNTNIAIYIGITYSYLPFMILPLYATLERQDLTLLEAAADLGAKPWRAFLSITLPLSLPGIIAGALLVFIPAVGEYVIPDLLGGSQSNMLGKAIWEVFSISRDWPSSAALSMAMLAALVLPLGILMMFQKRFETNE